MSMWIEGDEINFSEFRDSVSGNLDTEVNYIGECAMTQGRLGGIFGFLGIESDIKIARLSVETGELDPLTTETMRYEKLILTTTRSLEQINGLSPRMIELSNSRDTEFSRIDYEKKGLFYRKCDLTESIPTDWFLK